MAPNISICIPTYNREHLLKETLDSVFAQTYKDFEVVIVDDGSTDGTKEMLRKGGYNVRYHWQKNAGDAAARNKLIELAEGRYISFLDSDDLLFPDALEQMTAAIPKGVEDIVVYGPYAAIDEKGDILHRRKKKLYSGRITERLFENILIHSCGSLFPKKILVEAGGFNTSLHVCSDYDLWLKLSLKYDFIPVNKPVFKRRRHSGNLSKASFTNRNTEYKVLENFYYNGGGINAVPRRLAMRRLSKEQYRAARSAIRESIQQTACDLLKSSLKRHFNLKTLFWLLVAEMRQLTNPQSAGILILSHNPSRASFRQRISDYLPYLHDAGIQTKVCRLPENKISRWMLFYSARKFDAVLLHKKCLNLFDAKILRYYSKMIIYDFDDAIMYSPVRPENNRTSHFRLFRRTAKMADVMIAGNEYLAEHALRYCSNVYILPTGLDTEAFRQADNRTVHNKIRLVWIGSKITLMYLSELREVLEQVGKTDAQIVLRIIADDFFDMDYMPVEKRKWSLDSQYSDLLECDIGLAPLPDNRFTRGKCAFKILQYFAAGLPVVASPVSVNGDFIYQSGAGVIASTPEEWKEKILKMVQDAALRDRLGQNAGQFVQQYDRKVLAGKFCEIIKKSIQKT
ncbi:MAG: glycosyltransferase [Phycisphaerae bacterium]|jgi:glycosyltransferase involved in cell wall biosynthesis